MKSWDSGAINYVLAEHLCGWAVYFSVLSQYSLEFSSVFIFHLFIAIGKMRHAELLGPKNIDSSGKDLGYIYNTRWPLRLMAKNTQHMVVKLTTGIANLSLIEVEDYHINTYRVVDT